MDDPLEWRYTSPREVRRVFNEGRFWERLQRGELTQRIRSSRVPQPRPTYEPRGTLSQYISYLTTDGEEVPRVHQYLRPDGTIGASGLPDPKLVIYQGVAHYCDVNY